MSQRIAGNGEPPETARLTPPRRRRPRVGCPPCRAALPLLAALLAAHPAMAEDAPAPEPTGLWERATLLGDAGGARTVLDGYGISLGLSETSEILGNPGGGRTRAVVYEGQTALSLGVDLEKAIGLPGGTFNVSAFQIHGRGLSANAIGNLNTVSNIEADRATRLFELWYEQSFADGKVSVKLGQQSADLEFMTTQYGALFVNSSFGWPTLAAADLPSGGPAYPLATPGVRVRVRPSEEIAVLLGVYEGNPGGPGAGDPQLRNASGTDFRLRGSAFFIGEVQYAANQGDDAPGLPGVYKLGAWFSSDRFADQFAAASDPAAAPTTRRGNWSAYAVVDQLLYRPEGSKDGGLGVFARAMGAPGDRNLVNLFLDGGVTYKGAFGRDNDTMGLGVGWARISDRARQGDAALAASMGTFYPIRSSETVIEATYQAQPAPWLTVQPYIQYVINPGGGILNPDQPGRRVGNATVTGLRLGVTF